MRGGRLEETEAFLPTGQRGCVVAVSHLMMGGILPPIVFFLLYFCVLSLHVFPDSKGAMAFVPLVLAYMDVGPLPVSSVTIILSLGHSSWYTVGFLAFPGFP